jgi:hypothetical protein
MEPPVTVMVTVDVEGAGVPAIALALLPLPLFVVDPHPALARSNATISVTVADAVQPRSLPRSPRLKIPANKPKASTIASGAGAPGLLFP